MPLSHNDKTNSHYFKSDQVRRAMTFSSMYMGMSPFEAPATYTLLQYAEYAKGVFYPIGGFQTVVAAFEKVAKKFGAEFIYNTSVAKIDVVRTSDGKKERVSGVQLENGDKIEADVVVSNADLIWTVSWLVFVSFFVNDTSSDENTTLYLQYNK